MYGFGILYWEKIKKGGFINKNESPYPCVQLLAAFLKKRFQFCPVL